MEIYPHWEDEITSTFASGPDAADTLRSDLGTIHPAITGEHHLEIGVYIPNPDTGSIWAAMSLDLIVPDNDVTAVDMDTYEALSQKARRRGFKVLSRTMERTEVSPAPCIRTVETVAVHRSVIEHHVIYTLFPANSTEAVQLTFVTPHMILTETLAEHALLTADSLILDTTPRESA